MQLTPMVYQVNVEPDPGRNVAVELKLNPDQELLHRFALDVAPMIVDSNPLALAMATHLLRVDTAIGEVVLSYEPNDTFLQGVGVVQGGIVGCMLDFAMAFAVLARVPRGDRVTTANINVSYLRAAQQEKLTAIGKIDRLGKSMAFASARLLGQDQKLLATATSTLAMLRA